MKQTEGLPIDNMKIFSMFKIPMQKFRHIQQPEAKIDFLIDHMANNIKDNIRSL